MRISPSAATRGDNASGSGGPGRPDACRREETIRKLLGRSEGERLKMGDVEDVALELGVSRGDALSPHHGLSSTANRRGAGAETERAYGHCRKRSGEHRTAPAAGLPPVLLEALQRTRCGCSRREKRFLNLNVRGREPLSKFSNKMSNALANREFLTIRCIPTRRTASVTFAPAH